MQQTITLAEQCRQRILTALLKDRCKVTSILKEGSNYLEKEDKVLFGEGFQKKVHETIKLKRKQRNFLENIQNQKNNVTLVLVITIVLGTFKEAFGREEWDEGSHQLVTEVPKPHQYAPFPVMAKRPLMDKGGFTERAEVRNQPQLIPSSSSSKGKVLEMLSLREYKNVHLLVKRFFEELIKTYP